MEAQKIEISHKTVVFTIFFLIGLWVLYQIRGVVLIFFVAFVLMTALNPTVNLLQKIKLPRFLAVLITFIVTLAIISLIIAGIVPPLVDQTIKLGNAIAEELTKNHVLENAFNLNNLSSQIETISKSAVNVFKIVLGVGSNIIATFSLFVLTFYLLLERARMPKYLKDLFNNRELENNYNDLINKIEFRLGGWVRAELMLMFLVGVMTFLGLTLLRIPYALPLALLAGLLELVPNMGPVIAAIPSTLVALTISPMLALGVIILSIAVQQLENNLIVPMVMKQSLGLNPLITLMCLMVGVTLGGIIGAILAVPIFITGQVIVKHIYENRK